MFDETGKISLKRKADAHEDEPISKKDSLHTKESWLDEKTADVYFIIESEGKDKPTRIPAHKSKLANKSDVFNVMFFGDMTEKGDVHIVDVSVDLFKMFLRFFYDCNVELTVENITDVTNMCNKYNFIGGLEKCDQFLRSIISHDNIVDVYGVAITFERRKLKRLCEARIQVDSHAVLHSNSFLECQKFVLSHILDLTLLSCTEIDLFEACISWIKAASELYELTKEAFTQHFGDLLYKIRFPAMPHKDFVRLSRRYGCLIPADAYREISEAVLLGGSYIATKYSKEARQRRWNKKALIKCNLSIAGEMSCVSSSIIRHTRTTFSSNEPLLFGEFAVKLKSLPAYIIGERFSTVTVFIEELEELGAAGGSILANFSAVITSKEKEVGFDLEKPILIRPGMYYAICVRDVRRITFNFFKYSQMKKDIKLDDEVTIQLYDQMYYMFGDKMYEFVTLLGFNRL